MVEGVVPYAVSPIQKYFQAVDQKYYDKNYAWYYYDFAPRVPPEWLTKKLLEDIEWRVSHQMNFISTTEAGQGMGKSLFNLNLGFRLGLASKFPFVMKRDIYVNPFELDMDLRNTEEWRRTFLFDEQPTATAGMGSGLLMRSLKDYEEICRFSQKNLLYCSPTERDHTCYFIFRQYDYELPRIKNDKCLKCDKIFECKSNQVSTLCDTGFWERDGYPTQLRFMLFTKRLSDMMEIPRGLISFPMIVPEAVVEYDSIKRANLNKFEAYKNNAWQRKLDELRDFTEQNEEKLIKRDLKGRFKPHAGAILESVFYSHFSVGRFTRDEVKIFVGLIRQMLEDVCRIKNEEVSDVEPGDVEEIDEEKP